MGLDMCLYRKAKGQMDIQLEDEIAYWRNEWAIHRWFMNHLEEDFDSCEFHEVSKEILEQLVSICERCVKYHSLTKDLLPYRGEYDEEFYQRLHYTWKLLKSILKNTNFETDALYYVASW